MNNDGIGFFIKVSEQRLNDAKALLATQKKERERGSLYICGYSIECMLKAILIARAPSRANTLTQATDLYQQQNRDFPGLSSVKGHNLSLLFELCSTEALVTFSEEEISWFGTAVKWQHVWRYRTDRPRPGFAQSYIDSAISLVESIRRHC